MDNDTQYFLNATPLYANEDEIIHPSMCQKGISLIVIYPCLLFSILCWDMIWFIYQDSDYPVRRSVRRNKKSTTTLGFVRKWVMLSYFMMNNSRLIPDSGSFSHTLIPSVSYLLNWSLHAQSRAYRIHSLVHMTPMQLWRFHQLQFNYIFQSKSEIKIVII